MKQAAVKTVFMSIVMISFYSQAATAEKENCEGCASIVKATWGQFLKYACLGSTKLFLAHKLYTVAKEGYETFKDNGKMFKKTRKTIVKAQNYANISSDFIQKNPNQNQKTSISPNVDKLRSELEDFNKELEKILAETPKSFEKDYWRNVLQWNNIVGSLLAFVGIMDLYNCFKIARAMYNKEKTVRLEINFSIK